MAGSRVARNVVSTLATQIVSWGLTFLVTVYVPVYLHTKGLAMISVATAFLASNTIWIALGTNKVLIKEIARDRSRIGELVTSALVLRLPLVLISLGVGLLMSRLLGYDADQTRLILVALCLLVPTEFSEVIGGGLQGVEDFPRFNLAMLIDKTFNSGLQIAMVFLKAPIWAFLVVPLFTSALALPYAGVGLMRYIRQQKRGARPNWATIAFLARAGLPFLAGDLLFSVWEPGNKILLFQLTDGPGPTSWYEVTKRIGGATMVIPAAFVSAMLPELARAFHNEFDEYRAAVRRMFRLLLICAVPFAAILIFAPARVIELMHYPAEYNGSIPVLRLMGAAIVIWYMSQAAVTALFAADRQRAFARITIVAAVFCLPLCAACIWLTQRYFQNGAIGALLADVLIEICMLAAYIQTLPAGLFQPKELSVLARAMVAALPLVGALYLMDSLKQFYIAIPFGILFPALCVGFGCVDTQDIEVLKRLLARVFSRGRAVIEKDIPS